VIIPPDPCTITWSRERLLAARGWSAATKGRSPAQPPPEPVTILVQGPPADQFVPSSVHVQAGQPVIWLWDTGATGHNVTPDATFPEPENGTALYDAPHSYTYTFTQPGTYRYYCFAHGGPGGTGMSGVVIVDPAE
jgi:plastocyanin